MAFLESGEVYMEGITKGSTLDCEHYYDGPEIIEY